MKKIFFMLFVLLFICINISSCAGIMAHSVGMKQEDAAYKIKPQNIGENRAVAVFYGYDYLKAKEDKKAEAELRKPNYTRIYKYGYIQIRTQAWTAGTGNLKDWLFILRDKNKKEIYREKGGNLNPISSINDMGNRVNITYVNLHNIILEEAVDFPLYLRVITPLSETIDIIIEKK